MNALDILIHMDEMLWSSRLSPSAKGVAIEYLISILHVLDYHRQSRYFTKEHSILGAGMNITPPDTPEKEEALQYLLDKRVLTPTTRGYYRADWERAIAYLRMLDPATLERLDLTEFPETTP